MTTINPEIRAAEIVALIATEYKNGGWFDAMTLGEQIGWNIHEAEWYSGWGCCNPTTPRNAREWAGWLAREAWTAQVGW